MIPQPRFSDAYPSLGMHIAPLLGAQDLHVAEAIVGAVEFLADEAGPLWRDPRLYHAAITRALWAVGREEDAARFVPQGPYPAACVDAVWALCRAPVFHPLGVLMACAGSLTVESWPSSAGRPVVRLRLDASTVSECASNELLTRETLRPLLGAAVALLGGEQAEGVIALVSPAGAARPGESLTADARHVLRSLAPKADLWWVG